MNRWARALASLPPTAQRAIARAERVSLPRGANADVRIGRLRQALCRQVAVRARYETLDEATRAALHEFRSRRGGLPAAEAHRRYGEPRAWRQLLADPRPTNISERLLLLGWLFKGATTRHHPPHYLLPPELRRWLPAPLRLPSLGEAPPASPSAALSVAGAILAAAAEGALAVRDDGQPRRATIRLVEERLAPVVRNDAAPLVDVLLPLLHDLGLLLRTAGSLVTTLAGRHFLALSPADRLDRLRRAWLAAPGPDRWLTPLLPLPEGIDWPALRRRLLAWVDALPPGALLDPAALYPALAATLGPLANAETHGYRTVRRTPWGPRRAEAVLRAALRGPLRWFGWAAWFPCRHVAGGFAVARVTEVPLPAAPPWRYGPPGELMIPHGSAEQALPDLARFAHRLGVDSTGTRFAIDARSIARAAQEGYTVVELRAVLERHAGPLPGAWRDLLAAEPAALRLFQATVLLAEPPAVLARAARHRTVRRHLLARPAPGIALAAPEAVAMLTRALERAGLVAQDAPLAADRQDCPPESADAAPPGWDSDTCAALLIACVYYRRHAPATAPPLPRLLERRLRAALAPAQRGATDTLLVDLGLADPPPAPPDDVAGVSLTRVSPRVLLRTLRRAQVAGRAVVIAYDAADGGEPRRRTIRPLELEARDGLWYIRAYCYARRAERVFRLDRIVALASAPNRTALAAVADEEIGGEAGDTSDPEGSDAPDCRRVE